MKKIQFIVWLLVALAASCRTAYCDDRTARLVSLNNIDICDNSTNARDLTIYIDLGAITSADSLVGFNYEIKFDPNVIRFNAMLDMNTLSEFLDTKSASFQSDGKIIGYALNFNSIAPISGNRPLVAFAGTYIGDCPDTTTIEISYIEFNEWFKLNVNNYLPVSIEAYVYPKTDRTLIIESVDSVWTKKDSISYFYVTGSTGEYPKLDTIILNLSMTNKNDFQLAHEEFLSEKVKIENIEETENGWLYKLSVNNRLNKDTLLRFSVSSNLIEEVFGSVSFDIDYINDCSCILNTRGCKVEFKNMTTETTKVNDCAQNELKWRIDNGCLILEQNEEMPQIFALYNILGEKSALTK